MTALTATAYDDRAAVLLQVTGAPAGPVTITRTDANGTAPVRLLPDQEPIAGVLTVYDYEAALDGTATYAATDSAAVTVAAAALVNVPAPRLAAAVLPHLSATLAAVTDYDAARDSTATVHRPAFRSDALVVTGPMRYRSGTLTAWAGSYADARAVEEVLSSGEVALLRQPTYAGMDMYLTATGVRVSPLGDETTTRRWEVTVDYQEVKAPTGPVRSGAAWTLDGVEAIGTFATVAATFATFTALTVGP